jgi:DNA-binding LytR/AlgR family response regulator
MRLKNIEEQLSNTHFMRVHRSFIVALDKIKEIERNRISMGTKIIIPIGEQYREAFQEYMDKRMRINNSI